MYLKKVTKKILAGITLSLALVSFSVLSCKNGVEEPAPGGNGSGYDDNTSGAPSAITSVNVERLTDKKITVSWTNPSDTNYLYMVVSLYKGEEFIESTSVYSPKNSVTFRKLTAETDYTLTFVSSNDFYSSSEFRYNFTTGKAGEFASTEFNITVDTPALAGTGTEDDPYLYYFGTEVEVEINNADDLSSVRLDLSNYGIDSNRDPLEDNVYTLSCEVTSYRNDYKTQIYAYGYDINYFREETDSIYIEFVSEVTSVTVNTIFPYFQVAATDKKVIPVYNSKSPWIKSSSWSSSDESVATINEDGELTLLALGDSTITYTVNDTITDSVKIHVVNSVVLPRKVVLKKTIVSLYAGESYEPEYTVEPENALVVFSYSGINTEIFTVDENKITAKEGVTRATDTVRVYFYNEEEYTQECFYLDSDEREQYRATLNLYIDEQPTDFSLEAEEIDVPLGKFSTSYSIKLNPIPSTARIHNVVYESDNENVTVSEYGSVYYSGSTATVANITITPQGLPSKVLKLNFVVPVTKIDIGMNGIILHPGENLTITPVVIPSNATYRNNININIEDEEIATITNNVIHANKAGLSIVEFSAGAYKQKVVIFVTNDTSFTSASDSPLLKYSYSTEAESWLFGTRTVGKIDTQVKDGSSFIPSTANDAGWGWCINNSVVDLEETGLSYSGQIGDLELTVTPIKVIRDEVPYVMLLQTVTNKSDSSLTNQKIASGTDVHIHSGTNSPITMTSYGAILGCGNGCGFQYVIDTNFIVPVTAKWAGLLSGSDNVLAHMYDNVTYNVSGTNTGFAYSWQNLDFAAGETKTFGVLIGAAKEALVGGYIDAIIY